MAIFAVRFGHSSRCEGVAPLLILAWGCRFEMGRVATRTMWAGWPASASLVAVVALMVEFEIIRDGSDQ